MIWGMSLTKALFLELELPAFKPEIVLVLDLLMADVDLFLQLDTHRVLYVLFIEFKVDVILEEDGVIVDDLRVLNGVLVDLIAQAFSQIYIRLGEEVVIQFLTFEDEVFLRFESLLRPPQDEGVHLLVRDE